MRKILVLISALFVFFIVFSGLSNSAQAAEHETQNVENEIESEQEKEPLSVGNPLYPNSNLEMYPGDVLYTSKGWSTGLVGHTAIVGTDFRIMEVLTGTPAGRPTLASSFFGRHDPGDKITVLRATSGASGAATWATKNVSSAQSYNLLSHNIDNIGSNYCSKFVAQAFYHGSNVSLVSSINSLILPSEIKSSSKLRVIATITAK
ncbi:hypothetical protein [Viridibacillus arvi]|uniref:hypothetical protein n=1 Tax=Viridibacillus arvi TaxID=263475 RepID=UPI0034CFF6B5